MSKKPGCGKRMHPVFRDFFCANVHFEAKLREVVGEEGHYFFYVGPVFKDKCAVIYINHSEYIKKRAICEGDKLEAH